MREVLCFIVLIVVIVFGWNQPYSEHFRSLAGIGPVPTPTPTPSPAAVPLPRADAAAPPRVVGTNGIPQPTPDRSWIFEKTKMNAPVHDSRKGGRGGQ